MLWDLETKRRTEERYCDSNTNKVHLSDTGRWILCEAGNKTVLLSWDGSQENYEVPFQFVSNQKGRITFYQDKVLKRSASGKLELFDLNTKSEEQVSFPSDGCILATLMPDGSLLAVRKNKRDVILNSTRTNELIADLNREKQPVCGALAMMNKPFVAVATSNNKLSIYHSGTAQRTKIFDTKFGNDIVALHPVYDVIACGGANGKFGTYNLFSAAKSHKPMSWWYENPSEHTMSGAVLDLAFNSDSNELIAIGADGQIIYSHGQYCKFHTATNIIIDVDVTQYDFHDAVIGEELKNQMIANGAAL